jgi:hypothetical protein
MDNGDSRKSARGDSARAHDEALNNQEVHKPSQEAGSGNGFAERRSGSFGDSLAEGSEGPGPTKVASRIRRLHSSSLRAFATRKRVPHTLFWSLFRSEIEDVRAKKEKARRERDLFLAGIEEDSA